MTWSINIENISRVFFRKCASHILKQYMLKGYAVNHNVVSEQKYEYI